MTFIPLDLFPLPREVVQHRNSDDDIDQCAGDKHGRDYPLALFAVYGDVGENHAFYGQVYARNKPEEGNNDGHAPYVVVGPW